MSSLTDQVRSTCAEVAERSRLVTIDDNALAAVARTFDVAAARRGAAADVIGDPNNPERAIALAMTSVAINFTSGWHDIIRKRPGQSGAVSMVNRLTDYEHVTGALTPDRLQMVTVNDCSQIFEQELDGDAVEDMLGLLATALNDLGDLAADHGSFVALVEAAEGSAVRLATMLGERDPWNDRAQHDGGSVAFFKRAQMAAATLSRTFGGTGIGAFDDLDELTIFADNLVPHVLRIDGALRFDDALAATIDAGGLLEPGGQAEVEIRACGVAASERLLAVLRAEGHPINAADIDHALWTRGGAPEYKAVPRHRCRNRFY